MTRQTLLKVIAVQEMVGGVLGVLLMSGRLVSGEFAERELAVAVVPLMLFLLALFAGVLLWRGHPVGYGASVMVQLAQLLKVATPQFAFAISFGGDVTVLWTEQANAMGNTFRTAGVNSQVGSIAVTEFSRQPSAPQWFGVSIVSCVALATLRRGRQQAPERDAWPEAAPAPVGAAGEPDWVLPVWLKLAAALFALFVASCAGLLIVSR